MQFGTSSPLGVPPQSSQRSEMEEFQGNLSQPHSRAGVLKPYGEGDEEIRRWSASGAPAPRAPAPYLPGRKKSQVWSPARPRSEKEKKSPTASRDIRTALAVTGVHELMCGRPHCVGAFASVGPRLIFPDPWPVPDHEAAPVQGSHLVTDPARTATTFLLCLSIGILNCELPVDLASLQLLAQALAVVFQVLSVADLKASQIWGRGCGTTVPQSSAISEF